jgi:tRNA(fMet)-specific endonuclease VapC
MRYLLDTDICIRILRKGPVEVIEKIMALDVEDTGVSTITLSELEHGIEKSSWPERSRVGLIAFLLPFEIVDYDQEASREYGITRAKLEKKGNMIGAMDLLIAACVKFKGLTLVTNNEREFERVEGLKIENWVRRRAV